MTQLFTTLGPRSADQLGMILPHEHLFVDLRTPETPGFAQAEAADVVALMAPEVEKARAAGVTALVECTPVGVGRRADLDKAVSEATGFPVVMATGIYREPWVPIWAREASEDALYDWMLGELTGEIEATGVRAAWIKLSAGDEGLTAVETKILRAAARAAKATGAVIGSHTIRGRVVKDQLAVIESVGYTPERFIWIHTQAEPNFDLHLETAARGVWIEYDWIGNVDAVADEVYLDHVRRLMDAGHTKILLSHDRGWFDPGTPDFIPKPFTYVSEIFLPKMRAAGFDEAIIRQMTHTNPFAAFAR
ncbi:MAG: esterase [Chloroflexi bacterium]|nr:esterase [Chloroflexota bacterium]